MLQLMPRCRRGAVQLFQTPKPMLSTLSKHFTTTQYNMAQNPILSSENISKITEAEKKITNSNEPVRSGPTAQAQSHAGEPINSQTLSDITKGEKKITGDQRIKGGPTATAQSILSQASQGTTGKSSGSGTLDSETISRITDAEKKITQSDNPVRGGPTAQAQKHVGESINSENLHDITEGEKKITGGERVKGGPTSVAQSELSKTR